MPTTLSLGRFAHLVGIPFLEGARMHDGSGCIDCYGLVQEACRIDGRPFPDAWEQIAADWRRGERRFEDWVPAGWTWTSDEPRALDVLILRDKQGRPTHLGYMADDREVLHATIGARSILTPLRRMRARVAQVLRRSPP